MIKTETLDLHGVPHEEVEDLVHQFVNSKWRPNLVLAIVTGHSERMKSLVRKVVSQYDLEPLTADMRNPGQMQLATWREDKNECHIKTN